MAEEQIVNAINWDMVKAIVGITSLVMSVIGGLILAATKSIFITKADFKESDLKMSQLESNFDKKLYDSSNITIFMPRRECEKCMAEIREISSRVISKEEIRGTLSMLNSAIEDMRQASGETNERLSALIGRFEIYIKLATLNKDNNKGEM